MYRFISEAKILGTQLPEVSPGASHCGTDRVGWLNDTHIPILGIQVTQTVCFDVASGYPCAESTQVTVKSCGGYFIYNLPVAPNCYFRYCSV